MLVQRESRSGLTPGAVLLENLDLTIPRLENDRTNPEWRHLLISALFNFIQDPGNSCDTRKLCAKSAPRIIQISDDIYKLNSRGYNHITSRIRLTGAHIM
jgi:hypothetical protein